MEKKRLYIQAAEQVSIQQPLSEQWMEGPVCYQDTFVRAINPSFRDYIPANEVRRMGNIMKRALVTGLKVLNDTGIAHPDAIITGTGMGCMDYTVRFLDTLVENGEQTLSPTYFMQSTHNTVSSALAIYTKTHGYNVTYSHGGLSFEQALFDAWMQMQLGTISTALVGGHDEMVESHFELLQKTGYIGVEGMVPCGEVAMSMLLNSDNSQDCLCELAGISICHKPTMDGLKRQAEKLVHEAGMTMGDVSAVMTGVNGKAANDDCYMSVADTLFPNVPLLRYKHIFGENYTVSALGLYAAAHCLKRNAVPPFMYDASRSLSCDTLRSILMLSHTEGKEYALMLLKRP